MILKVLTLVAACFAVSNPHYRAEVLGPLSKISDDKWGEFVATLPKLKSYGVEAFASDIWWGHVEAQGDNQFDWAYYDKMAEAIVNAGLKWIPIMSTHQCGYRTQDAQRACFIPVPSWTKIENTDVFTDVFGNKNLESFSPWSGDFAYTQYGEFFESFATRYARYKDAIVRIDLSGGTSGELRYPSYSDTAMKDQRIWSYPSKGLLQAYSPGAVADFRRFVLTKYGNIAAVNQAWGSTLTSADEITPPCDAIPSISQAPAGVCAGRPKVDTFFSEGYKTPFGKDFGEWYQGGLLKHSARLTSIAKEKFAVFTNAKIAMKLAGVHWRVTDPVEPRSAERAVGFWDYTTILTALKAQGLEVTFTAIEKKDQNEENNEQSGARTLTFEFYRKCTEVGIDCGSENALEVGWYDQYKRMRDVLTTFPVTSLTYLRYNNLQDGNNDFLNQKLYATYVSTANQNTRTVFFTVAGVNTQPGETVRVVGSHSLLGSWNPAAGFPLTYNRDNTWTGLMKIPNGQGFSFEYKFVRTGGSKTIWQCGSDNLRLNVQQQAISLIVNQGSGEQMDNQNYSLIKKIENVNVSC